MRLPGDAPAMLNRSRAMNAKAETQYSKLDTIKLIGSLLLVAGALVGFYYYADQPLLYRVMGLVVVAAVAITVALQTERGQSVRSFLREVQVEVRKVVWPTRQETLQTTLIVIAMVLAVAIFLWLFDMILRSLVQLLTGQGG